jgi:hypothetical protein
VGQFEINQCLRTPFPMGVIYLTPLQAIAPIKAGQQHIPRRMSAEQISMACVLAREIAIKFNFGSG